MYRNVAVFVLGGVVLLAAASAQAGFVEINVEAMDGAGGLLGVAINTGEGGEPATVGLGEIFEAGQDDLGLLFSGVTDSDPVMTVTKVIENTTGFEWVGYNISLDPAGSAVFSGTPISNGFTFDSGASTSTALVFAPGSVPTGQSATFVFDILVPTTGPFGFTMTQSPVIIPEPSTLLLGLLLACGGAVISLRKRWG